MMKRIIALGCLWLLLGEGACLAEGQGPLPPGGGAGEGTLPLPAEIRAGESLTLARVVAIAQARHPSLAAAQGALAVSRGRIGQAESGYYPQVDASASYTRLSPGGTSAGPVSKSFDQFAAGLTVKQRLYDFGKTSAGVAVQQTGLDSARLDLATTEEQVVLAVTLAYYDLLKAVKNIEVALETVKGFEAHLGQAKGFFEAGLKPKYDVTKAEVDLSNARLSLIRAKNAVSQAHVRLNTAMGLPEAPDYEIVDTLRFTPYPLPFEQAIAMAYEHRPDLKAMQLKKRGAEQAVTLARKGDLPYLSGVATTSYSGDTLAMDQGWSLGMALAVPVFNGYLTKAQVGEAQANVDILAAKEASLRQAIHQEVEQGYLNLKEAEERIAATKFAIQQAEENAALASGRYEAGVGAPVEVTDADVLLVNARTNHIQALYDYRITQTIIEQAVGELAGGEDKR